MHVLAMHHVALRTPNFERLYTFYVKTVGMSVVGGFAEDRIVFIAAGNIAIELEPTAETTAPARSRPAAGITSRWRSPT